MVFRRVRRVRRADRNDWGRPIRGYPSAFFVAPGFRDVRDLASLHPGLFSGRHVVAEQSQRISRSTCVRRVATPNTCFILATAEPANV